MCKPNSLSSGTVVDPDHPHDEAGEESGPRTLEDALEEGGCPWRGGFKENGDSWHPRVAPHGVMSCVTCKCKVSSSITPN